MTKIISVSEDVYEELKRIKELEKKSFSEIIRDLLRQRYFDIKKLIDVAETLEFEIEKFDKKAWESIRKRAEELWKSA